MTGRHHRDHAIAEMTSLRGRRYLVWFNYHWKVFTRFDVWTFAEVRL